MMNSKFYTRRLTTRRVRRPARSAKTGFFEGAAPSRRVEGAAEAPASEEEETSRVTCTSPSKKEEDRIQEEHNQWTRNWKLGFVINSNSFFPCRHTVSNCACLPMLTTRIFNNCQRELSYPVNNCTTIACLWNSGHSSKSCKSVNPSSRENITLPKKLGGDNKRCMGAKYHTRVQIRPVKSMHVSMLQSGGRELPISGGAKDHGNLGWK